MTVNQVIEQSIHNSCLFEDIKKYVCFMWLDWPSKDGLSYGHGWLINPVECFFSIKGFVALDRNPGLGYNTLFLRLIPGDLYSESPHRQFHTLLGLLDSQAALPNSYACVGK